MSEEYGESGLRSEDRKVPLFLKLTYLLVPIWAVICFALYWNGSRGGWFDRGYWQELQIAANTTFPSENQNMPERPYWNQDLGERKELAE